MTKTLPLIFALAIWSGASLAGDAPLRADQFDLSRYAGQVVYMDFWASWCGPCRQSFPWMVAMQEKYAGQGLRIIAVNVDEDVALAQKFLHEVAHNFPIVLDPSGQLAERYQLTGMPSSYLIGRDGRLIGSHTGFRQRDRAELEAKIQRALADRDAEGHS